MATSSNFAEYSEIFRDFLLFYNISVEFTIFLELSRRLNKICKQKKIVKNFRNFGKTYFF